MMSDRTWRSEGHGMDWLIAGVLFILIVVMLVKLRKSERRPQ
jgi:hypothetical protein